MTNDYDINCCDECFSPSQDVNLGFGDVAVPESCKDEGCDCHNKVNKTNERQWTDGTPVETDIDGFITNAITCVLVGAALMTGVLYAPEIHDVLVRLI